MARNILFLFALAFLLSPTTSSADDSSTKGLEIMTKVATRDKGNTIHRELTLEITNQSGDTRHRAMIGIKKYYKNHSKTIERFTYPKNIKGTTLLTFDYKNDEKADDQWIYLPSLRKVKRIPASRSSDAFAGTDLTFEDMKEDWQLAKYNYQYIRMEGGIENPIYVIEATSKTEQIRNDIGYSKIICWIDKLNYVMVKAIYFDAHGEKLKTFEGSVTKKDGLFAYRKIEMKNVQRNHKTTIVFTLIEFNKPVEDNIFNIRNLQ